MTVVPSLCVGEAQPVEPGGPSGVEVALEAYLVPSGPVVIAGRCVAHGAPSMVHPPDLRGVADVWWLDRKVEGDVLRTHQHMC